LLDGAEGPVRDIVLLNAAAALIVAGKAKDLKEGVAIGAKSIASGAAKRSLEKLVAITNAPDAAA
jgi:anthranilate phosphoribosyltransferase